MNNENIFYYLLFNFFFTSYCQQNYNWPLENGDKGKITGTIGEPRSINGIQGARLHRGTDITGNNFKIYAINSGQLEDGYFNSTNSITSASKSYLRIGDIFYYHVEKLPTLSDGQQISEGQYIGNMMTGSTDTSSWPVHVHLQRYDINFLNNQISPFEDNTAPQITNVEFFKNGLKKI